MQFLGFGSYEKTAKWESDSCTGGSVGTADEDIITFVSDFFSIPDLKQDGRPDGGWTDKATTVRVIFLHRTLKTVVVYFTN